MARCECRGDAPRITLAPRRRNDKARGLDRIVGKAHLRALAIGCRMLERERQVAKSLRKHLCALSIAASRAALKQGDGFLERQHIKRDFLRPAAPIRKAGCNENPGFCGWQKIGNLVWARNIVVDEQPSRALLGKPTQGSLRSLLHIGFLCRRSPQQDQRGPQGCSKAPPASHSRAPTHAFIKAPEAIGVLDCKRRLCQHHPVPARRQARLSVPRRRRCP